MPKRKTVTGMQRSLSESTDRLHRLKERRSTIDTDIAKAEATVHEQRCLVLGALAVACGLGDVPLAELEPLLKRLATEWQQRSSAGPDPT